MKNLSVKQVDKMNVLTVKSYSLMDTVLKRMVGGVIGAFVILIVLLKKADTAAILISVHQILLIIDVILMMPYCL